MPMPAVAGVVVAIEAVVAAIGAALWQFEDLGAVALSQCAAAE